MTCSKRNTAFNVSECLAVCLHVISFLSPRGDATSDRHQRPGVHPVCQPGGPHPLPVARGRAPWGELPRAAQPCLHDSCGMLGVTPRFDMQAGQKVDMEKSQKKGLGTSRFRPCSGSKKSIFVKFLKNCHESNDMPGDRN